MITDKETYYKDMPDKQIEYDQPSAKPTPKVMAVGQAGIATSSVIALLALFGIIVPDNLTSQSEDAVKALLVIIPFVQAAIQWLAGYIKRDKKPAAAVSIIKNSAAGRS